MLEPKKIDNVVQNESLKNWHHSLLHWDSEYIKWHVWEELGKCIQQDNVKDDSKVCECCIQRYMTRKHFLMSKMKAHQSNKLIHSNLCGAMPLNSFSGSLYMLTFINNYLNHTSMCFLESKIQVAGAFWTYISSMIIKFCRKTKSIYTDNWN